MFDKPYYLLFLWGIPFLAVLSWYSFRKKTQAAARFLDPEMIARLMPKQSVLRTVVRTVILLAALVFLVFALAGPQYGVYFEEVSRKGTDVFILLDVSRSMLAEDVPPNRLQRAKSDIKDLLQQVVGDRVGLIVFAGKPIIKVPLTIDQAFFNEVLDKVDPNSAPRGGTAIGDAIRKALDAMPPEADREQGIVLITDGDDQESMPLEAAKDAAARKVRILTVGLGDSAEGGRIPIRDEAGNKTFLKHEGREVWSKVDDKTLQEIARLTGGEFIPAGTKSFDLGRLYLNYVSQLKGRDFQVEQRKKLRQQFQIFAATGVVLLLIYLIIPCTVNATAQ